MNSYPPQHQSRLRRVDCGCCTAEIVGVQHDRGVISPGETGTVRRQPANPYDRNAIAVYSPHGGIQVGHIKKEVAAALARLMDRDGLRLEPRVTSLGTYTIQCDLDFFSPQAAVPAVHNAIRALPAFLRWPWLNFDPSAGPNAAPPLKERMRPVQSVPLPPRTVSRISGGVAPAFDALLAGPGGAEVLFGEPTPYDLQPEAPQPALLSTLLLPHQRKAVAWMLQRERCGTVGAALSSLLPLARGAAGGGAAVAAPPVPSQFFFWRRNPAGSGFQNILTQASVAPIWMTWHVFR